MIEADLLLEQLRQADIELICGVPCSYLTPLINAAIDSSSCRYVNTANEGDAVAVAAGAELGGCRAAVMFQNSGLGNAVNPLTSLALPFRIPMLLIVTWRGQPGGPRDEPQHELMGHITVPLLELLGIPWERLPEHETEIPAALQRVAAHSDAAGTPYALVMPRGSVATRRPEPVFECSVVEERRRLGLRPDLSQGTLVSGQSPNLRTENGLSRTSPGDAMAHGEIAAEPAVSTAFDQDQVLRVVQRNTGPRDVVVATTGYTSRALYALEDRENQLYIVGSMGCASSVSLGLAMAQPQCRVLLLDGDGAALMRPSALAAVGCQQPSNLVHILLDNGVHDSTGAQATLSENVDFPALARGCGYARVQRVRALDELETVLRSREDGLRFLHVRTLPRSRRKLPRPAQTPAENANRLRKWMRHHDRARLSVSTA
jgi:phosphonopyruvate decarboxylase